MGEGFKADPDHIAGYGVLVDNVADQVAELSAFLRHAAADDGYTGLMELIKDPVDAYATATCGRMDERFEHLAGSSTELTKAAWMYSGAEEDAYTDLSFSSAGGPEEVIKDYPDPVSYDVAKDATGKLEPPEDEDADIRALLDDVGGSINLIDDAVAAVTGWSPVSELVEPMSGNWTSLSNAGTVLSDSGDAAENIASNLTEPLSKLDPHWNGGAANEFTDYTNNLAKAVAIEGPLNRIVGDVYGVVAEEIKKCAQWMVETLKKAVDKVAEAASTSWIPGIGWYKIGDAVYTAIEVFKEAKQMVDDLRTVVEQVQTVVEIAEDPVDAGLDELEKKLEPIKEEIEKAEKGTEVASDLAELSDTSPWENAPDDDYSVGEAPERDG